MRAFGSKVLVGLVVTGLAGVTAAGCAKSSESKKGTAAAPILAPSGGVGPLTSALPTVERDPSGYQWRTFQLNEIAGSGAVSALGIAPTGTDTLAAVEPLHQVVRISNGAVIAEDILPGQTSSIASVSTRILAALADPNRPGNGDLYARSPLGNIATWGIFQDTPNNEARVAAVHSEVYTLIGGEDQPGQVLHVEADGSLTSVAALGSAIPMAIAEHGGELWIGAMGNAFGGAEARLYRAIGGAVEQVALPGAFSGANVRQEITGMMSVAYVQSGAVSTDGVLLIAVGAFDRGTGAPLGGSLLATDGREFEVMASYANDAPTCLAFADSTIYVGTASGQLQFRQSDGSWTSEPNLPANEGIRCLLVRDSKHLFIGMAGERGALLALRIGGGGSITSNTGAQRYYTPDVKAVIQAKCSACHTNSNVVGNSMLLSANLSDDAGDFAKVGMLVNTSAPASSLFLTKSTNQVTHTGGMSLRTTDPEYAVVLAWITQGARMSAAVTPPPTAPKVTYVQDVAPILAARNCASCHLSRAYRLTNPVNLTNDFNATRARTDPVNPALSELLTRAAGQSHPVNLIPNGSADQQKIIKWITDGRLFTN